MKTTRNKSAAISCGRNWQTGKRAFFKLSRIVLFTVILAWSLVGQKSFSQGVGISETSIAPDPSSILELKWTAGPYKGFLVPRMTTANRLAIISPAQGLIVYDTTTKSFWYYDGGWKAVMGSGTLGTNNQLLGMDATGSFNEYKTLNGTTNQINVTFPTAGSIVLSTPQNIHTGASPVFVGLTLSGLTPDKGVYTTTGGLLTTTPPNFGTLGFWDRNISTLSPTTIGDHVTTSGNIYTTGSGAVTSAGLLTGQAGATISGGAINLNNFAAANITNIGTGTTTGAVTIGGTGVQNINIGSGLTGASTVALGSTASTTNIISGAGAVNLNVNNDQTTNINSGTSTGAVNIANSSVGGNTITIGNNLLTTGIIQKVGTGNFSLDGAAASAYNIGASTVAGTIAIGGTAQTGDITLGFSTAAQTVNIGTGSGANAVNIATGGTGNIVIGNATGTVNLPKLTASLPVKTDGSKNLVSGTIGLASADVSGVLPTTSGGTGQSTYTNGQILIGNTAGSLTKTTLTGTANQVNVANGDGSITLSLPQSIHSGASPTFVGLTLSGLTPDKGVYTGAGGILTTTAPSSGTLGFWDRNSGTSTLSPTTSGDHVTTTGNIYTTGGGAITSAGLLTGQAGATITGATTVSGGVINLNNNSAANITNIGTGTTTGAVTIGGTGVQNINIGSGLTGASTVALGSTASTTNIISGAGAVNLNVNNDQTTNINSGTSTGAVNIANSSVGGNTITIGNNLLTTGIIQKVGTGNFSLDGAAASAYNIGASTVAGTIAIGGTAQAGDITLGSSTAAQTVNIGTGSGANAVNIATGGTGNIVIGNATGTVNLPKLTASLPVKTDGSKNLVSGTIGLASADVSGVLPTTSGGTGQNTYTNGQILIGNTAGSLTKTTLTGTANQVNVANGDGSITLSLPQSIHSGASPTFVGLTLSGLTPDKGVYTGAGGILTTTAPSSGTLGFWDRNSGTSTLSPTTSGDHVTTTGNIYTTGGGAITSAGLLTGQAGATIDGGAINLNNNAAANITNIGTGTTTGAVTIGGTGVQNINIGSGLTGASTVALGSTASTTNIISGAGAVNLNVNNDQTTNINSGTSTGAVNIANSSVGGNTITIGNNLLTTGIIQKVGTGNFSLDGAAASAYNIGASTVAGTIAIGGTAQAGDITLGSSTAAQTVNIGTGSGANAVNIATGGTGNIVIGNATGTVNLPKLTASLPVKTDGSKNLVSGTIGLASADVSGVLPTTSGGTGQNTYTNGQILIGNTAGSLTKTTLTGTANQVNVANGDGSITLSLPQSIHSGASPTFVGLTLSGLTPDKGVYTGAGGILTTTAPSSGTLGFWDRNSGTSTLSPTTSGDHVTTTGNIYTTGGGAITSAGLLTGQAGATIDGGAINLNNNAAANITNIGTGTTTGAVTIGGTGVQNINIGSGLTGASTVALGSTASTTNIISGAGAVNLNVNNDQTTNINSGTSTGAVNIANSSVGGNTITIGNNLLTTGIIQKVGTGNFSLDGAAASAYNIGASTVAGTITIGGTAQAGDITLGSSTAAQTVNIGTGSGANAVNIATGGTGNIVIGNATGTVNLPKLTASLPVKTDGSKNLVSGTIGLASADVSGVLPTTSGGTGQSTYNNGQILIGNTAGSLTKTTLTGTANQVNVANGDGSITLSLPQSIHSGASPTFVGLTLSGLTPDKGVYTGAGGILTTTAPSSGTLGFWDRNSGTSTLSPTTSGDHVTTTGNIYTTGGGAITSAGLLTGQAGATITGATTVSGGVINLNNNSAANITNIGTGTTTGAVTIGGTGIQNINIGSGLTGASTVALGSTASTTNIISGAGAVNLNVNNDQTTSINSGTSTGAVNIANSSVGGNTITIGNNLLTTGIIQKVGTGNFSLDGAAASAYNIGASTVAGTIAIGGTAQAGDITLGSSTAAQTVNIGTGSGANAVNIATGGTGNIVIGNATGTVNLPKLTASLPVKTDGSKNLVSGTIGLASADVSGVLPTTSGGTGQNTYTNGQILIGNTAGSLTKTTLTGTANQVNVANGDGSITLSLPQSIHSGASPTFVGLTLSGLTPDKGVYTGAGGILTTTAPSSGTLGFWDRNSGTSTLSPTTSGDHVTTTGNIYTTGGGAITSAGLLTGQAGATIDGGAINLNNNAAANITNIGTGTTTGAVTIGGTGVQNINIGSGLTGASTVALGSTASTTNIISGAGAVNLNVNNDQTTNINSGTSTGAVNIANSSVGGNTITIGNNLLTTGIIQKVGTGNFSLDGAAASAYNIGASTVAGTIAIGGTAQAGDITLGSSTAAQTVNIGTGSGANAVNIATGGTGNIVIGNATGTVNLPKLTASLPVKTDGSKNLVSGTIGLASADVSGVLPTTSGGTGQNTYTNGQILIGNTAGSLTKTTLTGTANQVNVANGDGSITLSLPQSIHSGASPTFVGLTLSGLTPDKGVYTGAGGILTTTAPSSGTLGFWDRNSGTSTLSPTTSGDHVTTTGNIYTTGGGAITSAGLLTGQAGATIDGGAINLNNNAAANITNIGTGTTTGAVTIGGTGVQNINIGSGLTGASTVALGSTASTTNIISGAGAVNLNVNNDQTTNINSGTSTGAVNIANSSVGGNTITIGNNLLTTGIIQKVGTGNFSLDGAAASAYNIGASTVAGTITIGGTAQAGDITLGSSTAAQTVNIGTGSGANAVNIATGGTGNIVIGNATGTVNLPKLTASLPVKTDGSKNLVSGTIGLASADVSGVLPIANGGTNSSTALSGQSIIISNGTSIVQGAYGISTEVLHGNAGGAPTYGQVVNADIANNAVTYSKIQAISAFSKLLGSSDASNAVTEISLGSGLNMTGTTLSATGLGGTVTSFSSGDLSPLFTTSVLNPTTAPALSFSLSNAGAYTLFGNPTGASALPVYFSPILASSLFANQGTTSTVLHGNATGAPSFGAVSLTGDVSGILPGANGGTGVANTGKTITLGGNVTTAGDFNTAGAFATTLTSTAATNVTLPTTGTLATLAGNEALTNKTINGNTITAGTGTLTIAAGKTLTASDDATVSGTNTGDQTLAGLGGVPTTRTVNGKSLATDIILDLASVDFANQGTTSTVLHGNAAGAPSFGAVSLTGDVSGILPGANGGTGVNNGANTITLGGNISTGGAFTTTAGNNLTLTTTAATNVTLPISGTLLTTTGNGSGLTGLTGAQITGDISGNAANVNGIVAGANGGTGVANTGKTITLGGNVATAGDFNTAGAFATTLTSTAATNVTLPTTGTLATLAGNEALTNKTINGNTITAGTGTLTIAAGKTLTASDDATVSGTNTGDQTLAGLGGVPTTRTVNGKSLATDIILDLASVDFANQGTTSTVLHGNAAGAPSFGAVSLTGDVSGILPGANGGTGVNNGANTITLGGNISTGGAFTTGGSFTTTAGNNLTLTTTAATNVTLPTSGTLLTTTGNGSGLTGLTGAQITGDISGNAANVNGIVSGANGGTGVANTGKTITLGGNVATAGDFNTAGAFATTLTSTAATNVTLPTTGTLATLAGNEALTNKTINGNTITAGTGTLTIAAGKTLTASDDATVSGTNTGDQTLAGLGGVPTTRTVNGKSLATDIILDLASVDFANQGTTSTVLHGNAAGAPSFGAVSLTGDVSGILPGANGGTGVNNGANTITLGGNISTGGALTTGGAFTTTAGNNLTLTTTAATNVTLPTSGTLLTTTGNGSGLTGLTGAQITGDISGNAANVNGIVAGANGGTGVANTGKTITLGGNVATAGDFNTAGAFATTLTSTAATNVTLPTTGTLATLAGNEALTNKTINGNTITAGTGTLTIAAGKTLTASDDATVSGTNTGDQTLAGLGGVPTTRTVNGKSLATDIILDLASVDFANQGTTSTVLHGNAAGAPSFGAVSLTGDVSGILPGANGGTGVNNGANTITLGGNISTGGAFTTGGSFTTTAGNNLTLTTTAATNVTLPTSGTLLTTTGNGSGLTGLTGAQITGDISGNAANVNGIVAGANGGTGVANTGKTITLGGNVATAGDFNTAGAFATTLTSTAATNVTLPTTGTLATLAGNEALTNKTINGNTITAGTGTLTIAAGKTLTASDDATVSGTNTGDQTLAGLGGVPTTRTVNGKSLATDIILDLASVDFANQGTTSTVLHGNAAGAPSFGAVSLTGDVSGILPGANGGTGVNNGANTITLGGNISTGGALTTGGAFTTTAGNNLTLTTTAATNVTLPTSGTLLTTTGNGSGLTGLTGAQITGDISGNAANVNGIVAGANGGTGVANTGKTITLGGNVATAGDFNTAGAFATTLTSTAATNVTLPTTGTLATLAGNEALTNKTINGNTITAGTGTLTIAAGKTLTASDDATVSGTNTGDQTLAGLGGVPTTRTVNGKSLATDIILDLASVDFANQGTTSTVLHGNAAGAPSFGAVSLTGDVSGILPGANGGTGVNNGANTITLGGNISTGGALTTGGSFTTTAGNNLTLTTTAATNVTLPTSGTLLTTTGNGSGLTGLTGAQITGDISGNAANVNGIVSGANGGTGVANTGKTITLGGNVATAGDFNTAGAFATTLTSTAATNVTLPTTGTLATLAGNEALTNKTINGNTITAGTGTLTIAAGKTLTASDDATVSGTNTGDQTLAGLGGVPTTRTVNGKSLATDIILDLASVDFANQGTTSTVLHGNAAGAPSFGAVSLSADVSGILTSGNGGTGNGFTKFAGATTSEKTYTLPDASATILTTNAAVTIGQGGTGQTTAAAAFNSLSPITTLGDLIYGSAVNTSSRLAGNITITPMFLKQTGTGAVSAAPVWAALGKADVGLNNVPNIDATNASNISSGTLAIAYGGTGSGTQNFVDLTTVQTAAGAKTWSNLGTFNGGITVTGGTINLNNDATANGVNIGTSTNTGTVTIGGTGTQTISIGDGAGVKTVNLGSSNSTSSTTINSGTGALNIGNDNVAKTTTINLGSENTGADLLSMGSNNASSTTNIEGGTAANAIQIGNGATVHGIQIGSGAAVNTLVLGSTNGASTTTINSGTGGLNINTGAATNATTTLGTTGSQVFASSAANSDKIAIQPQSTITTAGFTGTITSSDLTAARTYTLPDASGIIALVGSPASWSISGNTGTTAANFLGTTDAQDLIFKANNTEVGRLESATGYLKMGDANSGTIRATKELVFREDGDFYGTSILRLRNRNGENGAIFETQPTPANTSLVDFIFKTSLDATTTIQRNIRFEARAANARSGSPSFHIGGANAGVADPDNPTLSIGDSYSAFNKPLRIGNYTSPTALLHLAAGTATVNTAPLKFTSGTLLTTTEAGAIEFNNDSYYATITTGAGTGAARKTFAFLESPSFTTPNIGAASGTSLAVSGSVTSSGTAGLGYATGAGGTITQNTNKATTVTLNKICGVITTSNATLNAGTSVTFSVNNSTVSVTDVPVVAISSAPSSNYQCTVSGVSNGSFQISIRNISGGNLGEVLVINYVIMKAVSN